MTSSTRPDLIAETRAALIGGDGVLRTPFGLKPLVYADYAASGRGDRRIEAELERFQAMYANPHTDDSATGRESTGWLNRAEALIKEAEHYWTLYQQDDDFPRPNTRQAITPSIYVT